MFSFQEKLHVSFTNQNPPSWILQQILQLLCPKRSDFHVFHSYKYLSKDSPQTKFIGTEFWKREVQSLGPPRCI